ncbi:MAG TPA: hypothetical protein GXZ82_02760 [Firmicutes bacterium]|nr:hypothetical protein [Bacillota bacterium]
MINNVILPSTTPDDWPEIRQSIYQRIVDSFGEPSLPLPTEKAAYEEIERYEKYGLTHIRLRYHMIGDEWNEGICVVPADVSPERPAPAVLVCHGSNLVKGKHGMLDLEGRPNRAYAVELAQRGYVTLSVDQPGFGPVLQHTTQEQITKDFYQRHPRWSLTGWRIHAHKRALEVLEQLPFVQGPCFGAMGHSLGGYAVLCLMALDERVAVGVTSTGVSPNLYNVYRSITVHRLHEPQFADAVAKSRGHMPWEKQEMIALCAPRALLMIEPFYDPYNPYIIPTFESMAKAAEVYKLLSAQEKISTVIHGDGHDTITDIRNYCYGWFDRFLAPKVAGA